MKPETLVIKIAALAFALDLAWADSRSDLSKGTEIIHPDSKEAAALQESDNFIKTAPKDNAGHSELLDGGDSYTISPPKINSQQIDVPDTESLSSEDSSAVVEKSSKGHSVVVNDYDPNNIGGSEKEKDPKKATDKAASDVAAPQAGSEDTPNTPLHSSLGSTSEAFSNIEKKPGKASSAGNKTGQSALHSFTMSFSMILFSEIGDKTFLIAALMAMKHARWTVFTAALSSLIVMSILSAFLGHALPAFLPKKATSLLAAVLFIVFGVRLFREGLEMKPGVGVEEEMEEVEHEIEANEIVNRDRDLESGLREKPLKRANSSPRLSQDGLENDSGSLYTLRSRKNGGGFSWAQFVEGVSNLASLVLSPVWVQVFVMTFLGEWGDRSQVATIAMAAGSDYWFVIVGAIAGHAICTGAAVVGGRLLATKISMRHVTLGGAAAFVVFSLIYFYEGFTLPWHES
ncbi:hypothetical protein TRVA0_001S07470 [Trichomonascus vanleenenianus]|uniref:putative ribosome biosynthesis protein GDT1 n=1 Tax=Trichomonascus vanleenenianus TaxID=2268995 RepID=UPI003ECAA843